MPLTLSLVSNPARGASHQYMDEVTFAGEASYATGGSDFDALFRALVGAGRTILTVVAQQHNGYLLEYDRATGRLKMWHGDNNNAADGPAVEVPATTNLSGLTFRVIVLSV